MAVSVTSKGLGEALRQVGYALVLVLITIIALPVIFFNGVSDGYVNTVRLFFLVNYLAAVPLLLLVILRKARSRWSIYAVNVIIALVLAAVAILLVTALNPNCNYFSPATSCWEQSLRWTYITVFLYPPFFLFYMPTVLCLAIAGIVGEVSRRRK